MLFHSKWIYCDRENIFSSLLLIHVNISIYTITGEKVTTLVSEKQLSGKYKYEWDAGNLANGMYYYRLSVGDFVQTKELMVLK